MAQPGALNKDAQRPADCPKDAAYIKTISDSKFTLPGNAPYPIVFEGGDGDDHVKVVGSGKSGVLVYGGNGNDSLVVEDEVHWIAEQLGPDGFLALCLTTVGVLGAISWRALRADK